MSLTSLKSKVIRTVGKCKLKIVDNKFARLEPSKVKCVEEIEKCSDEQQIMLKSEALKIMAFTPFCQKFLTKPLNENLWDASQRPTWGDVFGNLQEIYCEAEKYEEPVFEYFKNARSRHLPTYGLDSYLLTKRDTVSEASRYIMSHICDIDEVNEDQLFRTYSLLKKIFDFDKFDAKDGNDRDLFVFYKPKNSEEGTFVKHYCSKKRAKISKRSEKSKHKDLSFKFPSLDRSDVEYVVEIDEDQVDSKTEVLKTMISAPYCKKFLSKPIASDCWDKELSPTWGDVINDLQEIYNRADKRGMQAFEYFKSTRHIYTNGFGWDLKTKKDVVEGISSRIFCDIHCLSIVKEDYVFCSPDSLEGIIDFRKIDASDYNARDIFVYYQLIDLADLKLARLHCSKKRCAMIFLLHFLNNFFTQ